MAPCARSRPSPPRRCSDEAGLTTQHTPVRAHDAIGSTSAEARRLFEAGERDPVWVRADIQTGGYGRRGRSWASPPGNLYATLLWPLCAPLPPDGPAAWGFAAALSIREACIRCGADDAALTLKWPNDVLLRDAKLSGLLLELLEAEGRRAVALGVGVNLRAAPALPDRATAALASETLAPDPGAFLALLDEALARWRETYAREGLAPIREAWMDAAAGLGGALTANLPQETLTGTFDGLTETGALILGTARGPRVVTAGDVFFPRERA